MKTDINGVSTCPVGEENFDTFRSRVTKAIMVQYDFRHPVRGLFSCVAKSVKAARARRDIWLDVPQ
jgi:hypothetical protein